MHSTISPAPPSKGFTIVELLIVIVVIAILAAISIVAYNGVQQRTRDSVRLQDMASIAKALEVYKTVHGRYPAQVGTRGAGGWELSTTGTVATNFLAALKSSEVGVSTVPVDPRNTATELNPTRSGNRWFYFYYRYPAGYEGCDASRGEFYILGIARMDTVSENTSHSSSPGFSCPTRNWANYGTWVTGAFTN